MRIWSNQFGIGQLLSGILLWSTACAPRITTTVLKSRPPWTDLHAIILLRATDTLVPAGSTPPELLGKIVMSGNALTTKYNYNALLSRVRDEAGKMGGNALRITNFRTPVITNPTHTLAADVFYFVSLAAYERTIIWREGRRLNWADFKGRPGEVAPSDSAYFRVVTGATTYSRIELLPAYYPGRRGVEPDAVAKFNCLLSWVSDAAKTDYTLNHEQRHFEIAEIYARKLRRELQAAFAGKEYDEEEARDLLNRLSRDMEAFQEQYDQKTGNGIYTQPQAAWNDKIDAELRALEAFKLK